MPWSTPSWMQFDLDVTSGKKVQKVVWNDKGNLLAVAHGVFVSIFDWDKVCTVDSTGRRNCQRDVHTILAVPPLLKFQVSHEPNSEIVLLVWNDTNDNELAVGNFKDPFIQLYDLEIVNGWLQDHPPTTPLLPCRQLQFLPPGVSLSELSAAWSASKEHCKFFEFPEWHCLFLDHHVLLSVGMAIFCWNLGSSTTHWMPGIVYFYNESVITVMEKLTDDCLILGTNTGRLMVLDWKNLQRTPFSTTPLPLLTVKDQWLPHQNIMSLPRHTPLSMGIRTLSVSVTHGFAKLRWLTNCDWVLTTTISLSPKKSGIPCALDKHVQVLYQTKPPVESVDREGNQVEKELWKLKWIPTCCMDNHLVWLHDRSGMSVIDYNQMILQPYKPSFYWMD